MKSLVTQSKELDFDLISDYWRALGWWVRGIDVNFLNNYLDRFFEAWTLGYKHRYSEEASAVVEVDY